MKGILFTQDNIRLIREGKKTQTRRVESSLKVLNEHPDDWEPCIYDGVQTRTISGKGFQFTQKVLLRDMTNLVAPKPRYLPGELVYVKEAHYRYGHWRQTGETCKNGKPEVEFVPETDEVRYLENRPSGSLLRMNNVRDSGWTKRSAMFLPTLAARTFLRIKDVRPERLQDITEEDAIAEGVFGPPESQAGWREYPYEACCLANARMSYASLWDSINEKHGLVWCKNPWVWRIEFSPEALWTGQYSTDIFTVTLKELKAATKDWKCWDELRKEKRLVKLRIKQTKVEK